MIRITFKYICIDSIIYDFTCTIKFTKTNMAKQRIKAVI